MRRSYDAFAIGHATLLINPQAGNGSTGQSIADRARAHGLQVIKATGSPDVRRAIEQARGGTLFVAGGDGTINRTVTALAETDDPPTLGVIPVGTANDFAGGCGLPDDADAAFALLDHPCERAIDVVRVTHRRRKTPRYLINAATAGISGQIAELLDNDAKGWWGQFAYARVALELMPTAQVYTMHLLIDDQPLTTDASALLVCNGPRAGGVTLIPLAEPGDGRLDVAILTTNDAVTRAALLARFAIGEHMNSPDLIHRRCTRLEVASKPALHFVGDGERLGATPMTFELLPSKLRLLCGA